MVSQKKVHKIQSHTIYIPQTPKGIVYDILACEKGGWFYRFGTGKRNENPIPFEINGEKYNLVKPAGKERCIWRDSNSVALDKESSKDLDDILMKLIYQAYEENPK